MKIFRTLSRELLAEQRHSQSPVHVIIMDSWMHNKIIRMFRKSNNYTVICRINGWPCMLSNKLNFVFIYIYE